MIDCPRCGEYEISGTAMACISGKDAELRCFLSAYTRQSWEYTGQHAVITTAWRVLAEVHSQASMAQKLDKLMQLARSRTKIPGECFEFTASLDYPLLDAPSEQTASFLYGHACEVGWLTPKSLAKTSISFKGWEYLESVEGSPSAPRRAFVAMSFAPQLTDAYDLGIKPALEQDCGLCCIRMDRVEHNEKICDKILADIRRCHLLVADFTLQRPGVYFEAGFALGLNRTVIWSVRADQLKKVHFDTRQYNHIKWKNPQDLRTQLANRIQAITPSGRIRL